ncbi:uncharacterized protein V1477_019150 [Vespula maculifrons]|uniref:Uncharacterized protein n=1 Tax=Vespula maculifrons TaxID=7453 RepID=A0ABD2ARQ1_VESMC
MSYDCLFHACNLLYLQLTTFIECLVANTSHERTKHDMRVLFALLLTHCFGCVILQGIDDKLTLNRFDDIKFWKKCIPKIYKNINVCIKDNYTLRRSTHSLTNQFTFFHRQKMIPFKLKSKHFYTLQKYIRPPEKYHQRKLLIYGQQDISEYLSTFKKDSKRHVEATTSEYFHLRQRKQSDFEDDEEASKEYTDDLDDWDDWGAWSPCSVTCGCGQQVRWRHCITDDCIKGLKKAQIKTCHLRPCDKGFLSWLGIKL